MAGVRGLVRAHSLLLLLRWPGRGAMGCRGAASTTRQDAEAVPAPERPQHGGGAGGEAAGPAPVALDPDEHFEPERHSEGKECELDGSGAKPLEVGRALAAGRDDVIRGA